MDPSCPLFHADDFELAGHTPTHTHRVAAAVAAAMMGPLMLPFISRFLRERQKLCPLFPGAWPMTAASFGPVHPVPLTHTQTPMSPCQAAIFHILVAPSPRPKDKRPFEPLSWSAVFRVEFIWRLYATVERQSANRTKGPFKTGGELSSCECWKYKKKGSYKETKLTAF